MVAASGQEAVARARNWDSYPPGYCLKWVRLEAWGIGSLYASAIEAWYGARDKHPGDRTPPLGAPCFYSGGQYGHVVIFTGDDMRSTDCKTTGHVSEAAIAWVENTWPGFTYLGYALDLNGVTLPIGEEDDMRLEDQIAEWSPDDGDTGETTIGKTLNQARGYSEDTFQRVKKLEGDVDKLTAKVDKILDKLG